MTELQIKAAQLEEERRHNLRTEGIQKEQNVYNREHYERSDTMTGEHYQRSDANSAKSAQASLISANASAMNADTQRKQYELAYSLEYLPSIQVDDADYVDQVTLGYGNGLPLSAQKKIAEIEQLTLNTGVVTTPETSYYRVEQDGSRVPVKHNVERQSLNKFVDLQTNVLESTSLEKKASAAGKVAQGTSSVLNSVFGKGGIINTINDLP